MTWAAVAVGGGTALAGGALTYFGNKGSGGNVQLQPETYTTKLSKKYIEEMLGKSLGLMKGAGTPQDLPWFRGMEDQLNKSTKMQTEQLMRDASNRGIRGGTLEQLLKVPQEEKIQELLRSILSIYQQNPQQTMPFLKTAFDRQGQVDQLSLELNKFGQQSEQDSMNMFMRLFGMGMGGIQGGLSASQAKGQWDQLMKLLATK